MMRRWLLLVGLLGASLTPVTARAAVPSLELAPLKYEATLQAADPKTGYITVSNPGDVAITVRSQVQGMRQTGTDGTLSFYDDPALAQGITVSANNVDIPAHGAVNFQFLIDPDRLPQGGVYAAVFFQTVPKSSGKGSQVLTSARVGSLLLLQNGSSGKRTGHITNLSVPWFVYASAITATATYQNTGSVALNPRLTVSEGATPQIADGPYILPGASRSFALTVRGSEAGPVQIRVVDSLTGAVTTRWVFALTGYWRYALPAPFILLGLAIWRWRSRRAH